MSDKPSHFTVIACYVRDSKIILSIGSVSADRDASAPVSRWVDLKDSFSDLLREKTRDEMDKNVNFLVFIGDKTDGMMEAGYKPTSIRYQMYLVITPMVSFTKLPEEYADIIMRSLTQAIDIDEQTYLDLHSSQERFENLLEVKIRKLFGKRG
jgi:hypothetical protein